MGFPVLSSFCGLSLRTGGLIIGYSQFFLSAIAISNFDVEPVAFCVLFVVSVITAILFILGIIFNDPSYMRPNIIWGKIIFAFSVILCIWCVVWDVIFVILMMTNLISISSNRDVTICLHVVWIICAMVIVLSWYLVSLMTSLHESMKSGISEDIEAHHDANVEDVPVDDTPNDEEHTLLTFKLYQTIKSEAHSLTKIVQNSFKTLEKYFDKFQEYVARKIAEFVELPVEKTDDQTKNASNDDGNVKIDTKINETLTTDNIASGDVTVGSGKELKTNQNDAVKIEIV